MVRFQLLHSKIQKWNFFLCLRASTHTIYSHVKFYVTISRSEWAKYRLNFDLGKTNKCGKYSSAKFASINLYYFVLICITRGKMHYIWAESGAFSRAIQIAVILFFLPRSKFSL
jgi:hypothetical protein